MTEAEETDGGRMPVAGGAGHIVYLGQRKRDFPGGDMAAGRGKLAKANLRKRT